MPSYRYLVSGRVQGVGYRYFVMRQAQALGVSGFARNLPDGSVEVLAEGPEEALASLETSLRDGPAFASVTAVAKASVGPRGGQGFHIR